MNRLEILNKFPNKEDELLVSKLLDKIEFVEKRNSVEHTNFLDMRQRQLLEKVLAEIKYKNYIGYGGYDAAERTVIIIYPDKLEKVFQNNQFDYNTVFGVIQINLPNELKKMYTHRDYLGAVIKIGMKREKVGDIIVSIDGAQIIVLKEAEKYILEGLKQLKRFSKSEWNCIKLEEIAVEQQETKIINIIIPSMRIDSIVSEAIRTSRAKATEIIKEERVFINHELVAKGSKEVKTGDLITVRGKGRFKIREIIGNTKKGNLVISIEKTRKLGTGVFAHQLSKCAKMCKTAKQN